MLDLAKINDKFIYSFYKLVFSELLLALIKIVNSKIIQPHDHIYFLNESVLYKYINKYRILIPILYYIF